MLPFKDKLLVCFRLIENIETVADQVFIITDFIKINIPMERSIYYETMYKSLHIIQ